MTEGTAKQTLRGPFFYSCDPAVPDRGPPVTVFFTRSG